MIDKFRNWMIKNGDKAWHYSAFLTLGLFLLKINIWTWLFWIIVLGAALSKEYYDWKIGKEKKWDWLDLVFDLLAIMIAITLT